MCGARASRAAPSSIIQYRLLNAAGLLRSTTIIYRLQVPPIIPAEKKERASPTISSTKRLEWVSSRMAAAEVIIPIPGAPAAVIMAWVEQEGNAPENPSLNAMASIRVSGAPAWHYMDIVRQTTGSSPA